MCRSLSIPYGRMTTQPVSGDSHVTVIDKPLANLFVHAARPVLPDAEGANRARSASEAFLYRRLETLPEAAGRFRLERRASHLPLMDGDEWKSICCARI